MTKPRTTQGPADPFLTTRQAAQLLGVTLRSVQLWVEAGKLPAGHTPGGHRRIRTSAARALAAELGLGELVNPLQAQLERALADGKRLHDAYLGAERELESARAEIERVTEAGRAHIRRAAKFESERDRLRAEVDQSQIINRRATGEQVEINAIRCCTSSADHPATFTLGWRAAEAFHGIGAESGAA